MKNDFIVAEDKKSLMQNTAANKAAILNELKLNLAKNTEALNAWRNCLLEIKKI